MLNLQLKENKYPPALFLMGPTASGKTGLAIELCQQLPMEIISVDSALIYQGMDIGTAKPTAKELALAPHHLIDILDPVQSYSAADFRRDAIQKMDEITARGHIPLLVGGTMLYFKALLEGLSPLPQADKSIREQLLSEADEFGWSFLHQQLTQIDPISAQRIHPNDPQRLIRALEVFRLTGTSLTQLTQTKQEKLPYHITQFAMIPTDRTILHQRIEQRFMTMMNEGFAYEVQILYNRPELHENLPSIRCVGYRQLWQYFDNQCNLDEAVFKGICATRQLAKRQLTWLRNWSSLIQLNSENRKESLQIFKTYYNCRV